MKNIKLGALTIINKNSIDEYFPIKETSHVLINFNSDKSVHIIPFFEEIKRRQLDNYLNIFLNLGIHLRLDDLLGKLHIVILKFLIDNKNDEILIVNDVGFTSKSIVFLSDNVNLLLKNFNNKSVIIINSGNVSKLVID
ncbi:hypothetical protein [Flavobacterium sp.]|uniref:hypothetical protein n=1 Tax=Flavobacterium sp. TaxID=239 RepID=UPI00375343AF